MERYGGVEQGSVILNLGTIWGEWTGSHSCRFTPGENCLRYSLYRRMCGPQSQAGHYEQEKNLLPFPRIEP